MSAGSPDVVREAAAAGCGAGLCGALFAGRGIPVNTVVMPGPGKVFLKELV